MCVWKAEAVNLYIKVDEVVDFGATGNHFFGHNGKVVDIDGTCGQNVRQKTRRLLTVAALEVKLYVKN